VSTRAVLEQASIIVAWSVEALVPVLGGAPALVQIEGDLGRVTGR
jgi:hypothetical protein